MWSCKEACFSLPDYDYMFKVMVVGSGAVGKTSMVNKLVTGVFERDYRTTIGSQFALKLVTIENGAEVVLQCWDVCGQARFKAVRKMYYGGASGIVLLYDITRENTFKDAENWVTEAFQSRGKVMPVVVAGNKEDLRNSGENCVDTARGQSYAELLSGIYGMPTRFFATSSLDGTNISNVFTEIAELMVDIKERPEFSQDFRDNLEEKVDRHGWAAIANEISLFDRDQIMSLVSLSEIRGVLESKEKAIQILSKRKTFSEGVKHLREFLIGELGRRVATGGPTFELDIQKMAETDAAIFVADIIRLRTEEIGHLIMKMDKNEFVHHSDLWTTYYGRLLLTSLGQAKEYSQSEIKDLLIELKDSGSIESQNAEEVV